MTSYTVFHRIDQVRSRKGRGLARVLQFFDFVFRNSWIDCWEPIKKFILSFTSHDLHFSSFLYPMSGGVGGGGYLLYIIEKSETTWYILNINVPTYRGILCCILYKIWNHPVYHDTITITFSVPTYREILCCTLYKIWNYPVHHNTLTITFSVPTYRGILCCLLYKIWNHSVYHNTLTITFSVPTYREILCCTLYKIWNHPAHHNTLTITFSVPTYRGILCCL